MKIWQYEDIGEYGISQSTRVTDHEILVICWLWWSGRMFNHPIKEKTYLITPENCIKDFVTVHWAYEVGEL